MGCAAAGDQFEDIISVWNAHGINRQLTGGKAIGACGSATEIDCAQAFAADRIDGQAHRGVAGQIVGHRGSAADDGVGVDLQA